MNYIFTPIIQRCSRLEMDKWFHPKLYWVCDYLSMLGSKLNHASYKGHLWFTDTGNINSLRPRQNSRHFQDDIFKHIFLDESVWISIEISPKFVPKRPVNDIATLFQMMARRQPGDMPLSEPRMVDLLTHICVARPQWVYPPRMWYFG